MWAERGKRSRPGAAEPPGRSAPEAYTASLLCAVGRVNIFLIQLLFLPCLYNHDHMQYIQIIFQSRLRNY